MQARVTVVEVPCGPGVGGSILEDPSTGRPRICFDWTVDGDLIPGSPEFLEAYGQAIDRFVDGTRHLVD